jgi:gamma-glutamyltranspeptidase / glutathione hydrolase
MKFDYHVGYPTRRIPVFARNVVATSQPLAATAGLRMLAAGGNAIDAVIAAAAAITIVEPVSCGLGSDAFAIVWDGQSLQGLNASGWSPATWTPEYFKSKYGDNPPLRGWDSVSVPGVIAGWAALHKRYGTLPFEQCLQPAIELAEQGYCVTPVVQRKWAAQIEQLKGQPGFAQTFMPRGRAPEIGEHFAMPNAALTLRRIAASYGRDYYEGETAAGLVKHCAANGGSLSLEDLALYQPEWVQTISKGYRGHELHEIPPNGQGIAALMALGMLNHVDITGLHPDSAELRHLQIEAMKLAFADVYQHVADESAMRVSAADLLDDGYLAERSRLIRPGHAGDFNHGLPPKGGTIYLTAADANGMMVSFIQSNYMGFGSGVVVPELGVSLQNRGRGFVFDPGHVNCVAPRKRPFHTIIPAFLMKDGAPQMSFGVMGGNMQPQGHLQTLSRMLDFGQNPQAACDAPRWKVNTGRSVDIEDTMEPAVFDQLRQWGHVVEHIDDPYMDFGSGQFIWKLEHGYVAASDARRDGCAVGF